MRKSRLVICPFCDEERAIKLQETVVECRNCGEAFEVEPEMGHPEEFWHNPHTSASF